MASAEGRRFITSESILAGLLAVEIAYFAVTGSNFLTAANAFEVTRAGVEIGLLSLAMTAVILTGGIDLSVGSLLGLAAVLMGAAGRGGGLAEGWTGGVRNYTDFPAAFLFLGQGRLPGGLPAQLPLLLLAAVFFWLLLHRTGVGRGLRAIGFSPEGARYAGIPVARRLAFVYLLSGLMAGLAAVVYAARLGQAKADAGTGFELTAITAVVLGGTSIFGGRGTVRGTLLGLASLAVLQNGLRLADLPAELAGILTGLLLIVAIGAGRVFSARSRTGPH